MTHQVWKFPLKHGTTELTMPDGSTVLHVHEQDGGPCLWAQVNPNLPKVKRTFEVVGTGWDIPDGKGRFSIYKGTCHINGYVWHVYEL